MKSNSSAKKLTALVTGGNRGIGLATVERLAREGYHVILAARDMESADVETARLRNEGLRVESQALDVSSSTSIDEAVASLTSRGIIVDILVNNAGVLPKGTLFELSEKEIADSLAVHVTGPLRLIRALAPAMAQRRHGRIVNISSGWGSFAEGLGGPGAYGWTKAALNALTLRLSRDLPDSVKVNAMCPGWVRTRMGGADANVSPAQAADTAFWLATLSANGPTGGFFRDRRPIEW